MQTINKLFLAAALMCAGSSAATITFEGEFNTIYNAPITRSGFEIGNVTGDEQHFHEITSTQFGLPDNGTGILLNDRDTRIYVQDVLGGDFTLTSVDVGSALNNNPAVGLTVFGYLNNVLVGSISIVLDSGYQSLNGLSLGNIDQLVFDGTGGGGGFVLDNLNLGVASQSVPEVSSTLALVALGMLGLASLRRRMA